MGQSGLGRDHKLVYPTMCVSFLAAKSGSSISEAEAAGMASSGGRNPLLSIRLESRAEDCVMLHLNVDFTFTVTYYHGNFHEAFSMIIGRGNFSRS